MLHKYAIKDEILRISEDILLCGALNSYLSLASFPCSLYFDRETKSFYEVTRYIKNNNEKYYQPIYDCTVFDIANAPKIKLVSKDFLDTCRLIDLASFHQSAIYFSYIFVTSLNQLIPKKLELWDDVLQFFQALKYSGGINEYLCWIELSRSSSKDSLNNIRLKYFRPNPISFISSVPYAENRGKLMDALVRNVASYWVPRLHSRSVKPSRDLSDDIEIRSITKAYIKNCSAEEIRKLLICVLSYESQSGHVFQNFLLINKMFQQCKYLYLIKGCLTFYDGFSSDTVDCLWANRSAWKIISTFVMPGSKNYVYFPSNLVAEVRSSSNPPYEDLFDGVLEYALFNLIPCLRMYILNYLDIFESIADEPLPSIVEEIVQTIEAPLDNSNKEIVEIDSIHIEKAKTDKSESIKSKVQKSEQENLMLGILRNRNEFERLKSFLRSLVPASDDAEKDANPMMDLDCYIDIEKFKMSKGKQGNRDELATNIKQIYLTKKYFFGPSSPAPRNVQIEILGGSGSKMPLRPSSPVIFQVQKHALYRLNNKWVKQYQSTEDFQKRQDQAGSSLSRRKGNESAQNFVFVDSKARANAHEMLQLRRTLLDPIKSISIKRYAKAKSERLLRDIEFWVEVQKYKDMQHRHSTPSLIRKKIDAIIGCFLDSAVQPRVQVSVNNDIANKIAESRYEMGPYLFRKAQSLVTKVLVTLWTEFNSWCAKYNEQLPIAFQKLELDAEQKRLVKQMLRQKQNEEEKEKTFMESSRRLVVASGKLRFYFILFST